MDIRSFLYSTLLTAASLTLASCDDGRIYPSDGSETGGSGRSVVMKGEVTGCGDFYGTDYSVVLAAFCEGNRFASVTKTVSDGSEDVTLTNISGDAASVELCVINRLRERIFTLATLPLTSGQTGEITFEIGKADASPFNVIETGVFATTCSQCHGATGHAAAGLDLLPEQAYAMLVGVSSTVIPDEMRVAPGDASASTLWQALPTDISDASAFSHSYLPTFAKTGFKESWTYKCAEQ